MRRFTKCCQCDKSLLVHPDESADRIVFCAPCWNARQDRRQSLDVCGVLGHVHPRDVQELALGSLLGGRAPREGGR